MSQSSSNKPALELKGRMMTLTMLRLLNPSVEVLAEALDRKMQEAPDFFRHLPVVLDVEAVADTDLYLDLAGLVGLLRAREFLPVGIRGGDERWSQAAETAGLGVFSGGADTAGNGGRKREEAADVQPAPSADGSPSLVVTQPVRSGQQLYARGGDLIILSSVSPGAELLADGHIHVYGTLYGRALAGVRGDANARIFCQGFRAELVSVAGTYSVSEQFDEGLLGRPVQVSLVEDSLHIRRL
ncbi:MAG: septum site-determining protein MinC [Ectothiorhodospiraceae bacterium]|nr:septum site-determining protein MinC [Ectothiorhodospiraceae bacterium]